MDIRKRNTADCMENVARSIRLLCDCPGGCYKFCLQLPSWVCWRQIHHWPNFHSTADPPEVPRAPDPNASPVHRPQGGPRHHRPEKAMEHHAAVPLPWEVDPAVRSHHERGAVQGESIELDIGIVRISQGSEARLRALLSALQQRPGRCHSNRGARQRHPWYDPLAISPISWLCGWYRHHRQDNSEGVWGVHPTQTRSSKNLIQNQCDEDEVPTWRKLRPSGKQCISWRQQSRGSKGVLFVTSNNDISSEIRRRIVQGNRAYYGLHPLLKSKRLRARTKCEIYWTLIRRGSSRDTSPGPFARRMQTLWACLSDASSEPSLAVCSSMERGGEEWTTSLLSYTANRASWQWQRLSDGVIWLSNVSIADSVYYNKFCVADMLQVQNLYGFLILDLEGYEMSENERRGERSQERTSSPVWLNTSHCDRKRRVLSNNPTNDSGKRQEATRHQRVGVIKGNKKHAFFERFTLFRFTSSFG